jgi:hypothetical protein
MFQTGRIVITPGATAALADSREDYLGFFIRHCNGDWGDLDEEDKATNDAVLATDDGRLISAYTLKSGEKIWIITEADRRSTTILLPDEY